MLLGGGRHYHYPKSVWTPAGGWWNKAPEGWQVNTAIAGAALVMTASFVFKLSAENEVGGGRPHARHDCVCARDTSSLDNFCARVCSGGRCPRCAPPRRSAGARTPRRMTHGWHRRRCQGLRWVGWGVLALRRGTTCLVKPALVSVASMTGDGMCVAAAAAGSGHHWRLHAGAPAALLDSEDRRPWGWGW